MVNARHKEVLKGSTSKEAGPSASDADHGDSGSSFSSKGLNFRGFTLSSMKLRQVGKAIKNAMPYYISQTTDNFKELLQGETQINFASNFLRDRAKMWWDEKVCDKGEEWIGSCTWKDFIELFNAEYAPAEEVDKIREEFETRMQTNKTVKELLKKFNELIPYCPGYHGNEKLKVREADLLRKKNKEGKETKRKLEFGDQDTKKPKHDHGRRGGGTQTKTPCKKCNKAHLG
ncbi:zinc finger, CCHC-type, retrotransposon gag domain protein [Tanacetum coccineum]